MTNTSEVVFNFLFYLAFVRLFFCTGTEGLNKKFITAHATFFPHHLETGSALGSLSKQKRKQFQY